MFLLFLHSSFCRFCGASVTQFSVVFMIGDDWISLFLCYSLTFLKKKKIQLLRDSFGMIVKDVGGSV